MSFNVFFVLKLQIIDFVFCILIRQQSSCNVTYNTKSTNNFLICISIFSQKYVVVHVDLEAYWLRSMSNWFCRCSS